MSTSPAPLSETRNADEIASPCDENIRPIFPVRHALTEDALFNITRDGHTPGNPKNIGASSDHELRRIRQGYIYIYARNGHPENLGSDSDGTWLVFRYVSRPDLDDSSSHIRADVNNPNGRYQFYKLEWTGGGADGQWEVKDTRRYPYAFVNKQVSEIEIAYSEERWPGHLFLMAQLDSSVRSQLMTPVNVIQESTEHSAPLAQISAKVAEFNSAAEANPPGNAIRYTAFQPEAESQVVICQNSRENGRLVAIQDHLGELMDIQAAHLAKSHSLKTFSAEYQYPLMIGKGVKNLWEHIDHAGGTWDFLDFNGTPLSGDYLGAFDAIEVRQQVLNAELKALVRSYWAISTRTGPGTVMAEIKACMDGLEKVSGEAEARRVDYVFFLLSKAFQTIGTSAYGSASMVAMLGGTASDRSKEWLTIFKTALGAAATAAPNLLQKYRTHINMLFTVASKELAMAWVKSPGGVFYKEAVPEILGLDLRIVHVSPDNIGDTLREVFDSADARLKGSTPRSYSFDKNALTVTMDGGTAVPEKLVGVQYFEITGTGTLTEQGQKMSEYYRAGAIGTEGAGLFLSFYAAFQTLQNWDNVRPSFTGAGAVARDPRIQIASALLDSAASLRGLQKASNAATFSQGVSSKIFSRMFATGADGFFTPQSVAAQAQNGINATSGGLMRYVTIGNIAGAAGIALAGAQAYEGYKADDMAAGIGNSLVAAGGLVLLITGGSVALAAPGAIIGGLMIIAGTVSTFFTDSDVDYWVRHGFWGRSKNYWGEQREQIDERLSDARRLAYGAEPQRSAFEQELKDYKDLTGTLKIKNETEGDMRFEIFCPAVDSIADLNRLTATVRKITPGFGMGGGGFSGPVVPAAKHFINPGLVHLVLEAPPVSEQDRMSDLRVDASFPKLTGGEFSDRLTIKAWKL
ncbi:toxin VasX [Leisingera sp. ANG-M7]|uniref:toxin VasX n=1 Tax=Leisingera sp. ANG-M7 TaxID=1577902 RepID=UPI00057DEF39|nr:toxin VasX [Leisingera sp. ANG-M7]KIC36986.1 hypothetical protein RA26_11835 [Leisingera sp. ANG-M7]